MNYINMIGTRALSNSAAHDPHVSQTDRQTDMVVSQGCPCNQQ